MSKFLSSKKSSTFKSEGEIVEFFPFFYDNSANDLSRIGCRNPYNHLGVNGYRMLEKREGVYYHVDYLKKNNVLVDVKYTPLHHLNNKSEDYSLPVILTFVMLVVLFLTILF